MKTFSTTLALLLCVSAAGIAHAEQAPAPAQQAAPGDPWGDATVTREQALAKAELMFDQLDADHDGAISQAEEQAAAQQAGPGLARALGGMMRRSDANGDGKLAKAEFLASQGERFDRQDANHDGKLSKAERDAARAAMQRRSGGSFGPPAGGGR